MHVCFMKYEGCAPLSYKSYIRPCLKLFLVISVVSTTYVSSDCAVFHFFRNIGIYFLFGIRCRNSHAIFIKLNTNSSQMLSDKIYQYILFTVVSFCKGIDCAAQIFLGIL